jgi:hypothetical protein
MRGIAAKYEELANGWNKWRSTSPEPPRGEQRGGVGLWRGSRLFDAHMSSPPDLARPAAHESLFYIPAPGWMFFVHFLFRTLGTFPAFDFGEGHRHPSGMVPWPESSTLGAGFPRVGAGYLRTENPVHDSGAQWWMGTPSEITEMMSRLAAMSSFRSQSPRKHRVCLTRSLLQRSAPSRSPAG